MDRLDKISAVVIAVCVVWTAFLVNQASMVPVVSKQEVRQAQARLAPEYSRKLKIARVLLESGNLRKAEDLALALVATNPYVGASHMLLGDIRMRKQELVKAMYDYKSAVELNPDFLDKKTALFQGKKIRTAMQEVQVYLDQELNRKPDDQTLKEQKKILYYMQRKLAGSCG